MKDQGWILTLEIEWNDENEDSYSESFSINYNEQIEEKSDSKSKSLAIILFVGNILSFWLMFVTLIKLYTVMPSVIVYCKIKL